MPKIIVNTGGTQDGEYDLDLSRFTWRERAYITEVSGTLPPEFIKKWFDNDPMTILATVGVMMQRAGKIPNLDAIMDADDTALTIDYTDLIDESEGDDASPPDEASPPKNDDSGEKSEDVEAGG
jgi:hypothetical protein